MTILTETSFRRRKPMLKYSLRFVQIVPYIFAELERDSRNPPFFYLGLSVWVWVTHCLLQVHKENNGF